MKDNLSEYSGRKRVESLLRIKKKMCVNNYNEESSSMKYFIFDLEKKCFGCKNKKEDNEYKFIYYSNELVGFSDSIEDYSFDYGFKIITKKIDCVLFAGNKFIFSQWMRILNFAFNKIDIYNPNFVVKYNFFLNQSNDNYNNNTNLHITTSFQEDSIVPNNKSKLYSPKIIQTNSPTLIKSPIHYRFSDINESNLHLSKERTIQYEIINNEQKSLKQTNNINISYNNKKKKEKFQFKVSSPIDSHIDIVNDKQTSRLLTIEKLNKDIEYVLSNTANNYSKINKAKEDYNSLTSCKVILGTKVAHAPYLKNNKKWTKTNKIN